MSREVFGIILAGGRSRRMGRDKSTVLCGGRTLLALVRARLEPQCAGLVLSRQSSRATPSGFEGAVAMDDLPGHAGPLAGILAGLDWLAQHREGATHAVIAAVDTPFLPLDLVARLAAERDRAGAVLACAASGERRHPAVGLWPVTLRHALRSYLVEENLRKVGGFLDRHPLAIVVWPSHPFDPFLNLNTPADVAAAEALMERPGGVSVTPIADPAQ